MKRMKVLINALTALGITAMVVIVSCEDTQSSEDRQSSLTVSVSERPKKADTDVRDSYVLFSIESTVPKTDYHLAVKETALAAPTATEMTAGALKRNISDTAINVLIAQRLNAPMITFAKAYFADNAQTTLGAGMFGHFYDNQGIIRDDDAAGTDKWVTESVLKPSTEYKLYGMENNGSAIRELLTFSTDATAVLPTYTADNIVKPIDSTLEEGHIVIAVNADENYILPLQWQFKTNDPIINMKLYFSSQASGTNVMVPDWTIFGVPDPGFIYNLFLFKDKADTITQESAHNGGYVLMSTSLIEEDDNIDSITGMPKRIIASSWNYGVTFTLTESATPAIGKQSFLVRQ